MIKSLFWHSMYWIALLHFGHTYVPAEFQLFFGAITAQIIGILIGMELMRYKLLRRHA